MSNAILGVVEYPSWHPVASPKRMWVFCILHQVYHPCADVSSALEYQMAGRANMKELKPICAGRASDSSPGSLDCIKQISAD